MDNDEAHKITLMMAELVTKMQVLLEKQDELGENISKIKEAVYNPDNGLYARLSRLDSRLDALEAWKDNNTKIIWIIITVSLGLITTTAWQTLF
tara:strand:- start:2312 stop:2593 length:282 start_codon:yes stop_codon:yes gene_type:complete